MRQGMRLEAGGAFRRVVAALVITIVLGTGLAGCAAFNPQGAAQQAAPSYYNNQDYASLTPQQKMQLEDHISNQSNQAWRTTANMTSAVGQLAGGTGILLFAARGGRFW
jgi:uncharacterized protein HemX